MNSQGTKDWFYWVVNNVSSLGAIGVSEDDLNKCIKGAKVGLIKDPKPEKDYTKCWAYSACKITPDW